MKCPELSRAVASAVMGLYICCAAARLRLLRAPTESCKYPAAISTADAQFVPADALALVGSQARMHQSHTC